MMASGSNAKKQRRSAAPIITQRDGLPWLTIVAVGVIVALAGTVFFVVFNAQRDKTQAAEQLQPFVPTSENRDPSTGIPDIYVGDAAAYKAGQHVDSPVRVAYDRTPAIGGPHDAEWAACNGVVYSVAVRTENMVHTLEHGAIWITYNPDTIASGDLDTLKTLVEGKSYITLSPYPGLSSPISLQAWRHQLMLDSAADPRVQEFITALQRNQYVAPEINGTCEQPTFDIEKPPPFDATPVPADAVKMDGSGGTGTAVATQDTSELTTEASPETTGATTGSAEFGHSRRSEQRSERRFLQRRGDRVTGSHPGPGEAGGRSPSRASSALDLSRWGRSGTRIVLALLAVVLLLVGAIVGLVVGGSTAKQTAGSAGVGPGADSIDVGFLRDMTVHHEQGVLLAHIAQQNGGSSEVAGIAYDIEYQQTSQIGQMGGFLLLWGYPLIGMAAPMSWMTANTGETTGMAMTVSPAEAADGVIMPGMATNAEVDRLKTVTGAASDTLFLQLMVRHHQGGLPMMAFAAAHATNPVVQNMAQKMEAGQVAEIATMTDLLSKRFGAAPLPAPDVSDMQMTGMNMTGTGKTGTAMTETGMTGTGMTGMSDGPDSSAAATAPTT